jgi:hypothetical protein
LSLVFLNVEASDPLPKLRTPIACQGRLRRRTSSGDIVGALAFASRLDGYDRTPGAVGLMARIVMRRVVELFSGDRPSMGAAVPR